MAEYIEKEKVIERIDLSIKSWSADYNSNSSNMVRAYKDVKSRLESIPAADVAPVVHGEWIKRCITSVDSPDVSECSICKYPVSTMWGRTNYCPNCGADMKGESKCLEAKEKL